MTTKNAQSTAGRARHRRVIAATEITGTALLGLSLSRRPGSPQFYLLALGAAATWTVGAVRSRQAPSPRARRPVEATCRSVVVPVLTGAGLFGLTCGAAIATRHIPILDRAVKDILRFADGGPASLSILTTGANAIAEELFFRGALFSTLGESRPVITSTIAYTTTTTATRNPALVLAGATLGTLFGLQRRVCDGVLAPALTHLTWSLLTLRFLPRLARTPVVPLARPVDGTTRERRCGRFGPGGWFARFGWFSRSRRFGRFGRFGRRPGGVIVGTGGRRPALHASVDPLLWRARLRFRDQ
jgi:membrane protease YdiL (CAAX protease family)